ncbi:hypothetical protein PCL_07989 [Purpureocillium lilacinum]|uniref:Uncharacterized protein n=1 Tax=Purpureocillium lilacinum TaxID=33203 RepID=A0A2U3EJH4_PURLI|nr:hypothetical protein PCL_07989 [Purpureocillium lilacinum]
MKGGYAARDRKAPSYQSRKINNRLLHRKPCVHISAAGKGRGPGCVPRTKHGAPMQGIALELRPVAPFPAALPGLATPPPTNLPAGDLVPLACRQPWAARIPSPRWNESETSPWPRTFPRWGASAASSSGGDGCAAPRDGPGRGQDAPRWKGQLVLRDGPDTAP